MSIWPNAEKFCHRTGFEKSCRDLVKSEKCQDFWRHYEVTDRQTLQKKEFWACSDQQKDAMMLDALHKLNAVSAEIQALRTDIDNRANGRVTQIPINAYLEAPK
jgi:hypothetical protein